MDIDFTLLDQLKRYFQGDLGPAEARTVANRLEKDPIYQAHAQIYKISQKGVSAHQKAQNITSLKDFPASINIQSIWEQDQKLTRKKRWIFGLLALLLLISAGLWVLDERTETPASEVQKSSPPIADSAEEESEALFGSEGEEQILNLNPLQWQANSKYVPLKAVKKTIVVHPLTGKSASYSYQGDTLHLYLQQAGDQLIQWIITKENIPLLRLDSQLFSIPQQSSLQPLRPSDVQIDLPPQ